LADRYKTEVNMLTWAFEFEDKPYFEGYRTLATNGVDKPVMNAFRIAGLLRGERVSATSSGAIDLDAILAGGVRGTSPDIDAIATRAEREISTMIWNYHDDDTSAAASPVHLTITGVPARVRVEHFRIDDEHSNAYVAWKRMGSPQQPTPEQYIALESAGQLQTIGSPSWMDTKAGKLDLTL